MKRTAMFVLMFLLLVFSGPVFAGSGTTDVTLMWDPPDISTDVTGYDVLYGTEPGVYPVKIDVGLVTTYTEKGLKDGTYYFVVDAYNAVGYRSVHSNEVSGTYTAPPDPAQNLRIMGAKVTVKDGQITSIEITSQPPTSGK